MSERERAAEQSRPEITANLPCNNVIRASILPPRHRFELLTVQERKKESRFKLPPFRERERERESDGSMENSGNKLSFHYRRVRVKTSSFIIQLGLVILDRHSVCPGFVCCLSAP